jgi:hypothetical protein
MFLIHARMLLGALAFMTLESDSGDSGDDSGGDGDGDDGGDGDGTAKKTESSFKAPANQAELDRLISRRLKKAREDAAAEATTAAQRAAEVATAKEKDDVRKLLEIEQDKVKELELKVKNAEVTSLRTKVANAHKLPDELADLLKGETEEELTVHAKKLAELVTKGKDTGSDDGSDDGDIDNDAGAQGTRKKGNRSNVPQFRIASTKKTVKWPGT